MFRKNESVVKRIFTFVVMGAVALTGVSLLASCGDDEESKGASEEVLYLRNLLFRVPKQ